MQGYRGNVNTFTVYKRHDRPVGTRVCVCVERLTYEIYLFIYILFSVVDPYGPPVYSINGKHNIFVAFSSKNEQLTDGENMLKMICRLANLK